MNSLRLFEIETRAAEIKLTEQESPDFGFCRRYSTNSSHHLLLKFYIYKESFDMHCRLLFFIAIAGLVLGSAAVAQDEPAKPSVPVFKDGEAQIVAEFKEEKNWIRHDLWVETQFDSDGDGKQDRVHVAVTRPQQTDTQGLVLPVIYETSPYFAGTGTNNRDFFWNPHQEIDQPPPTRLFAPQPIAKSNRPIISSSQLREWLPRGYVVVHSSSPGTGLSQGCPTVGGDNEALAPKAVIDWLCGRAKGFKEIDGDETVDAFWCSGKIGMTGTSYNGTLPLAAATTGVAGLEAIIPIAPNTSYYHYYRSNGLVRHPGGYMGEDIDVLYEFIHSGNPDRKEYCDCEVRDVEMRDGMDRTSGDYNAFWKGRDYLPKMSGMKAALLMSHAFNDWNVMPEHSVRIYEAAKQQGLPVQAYFHQDGHGGPPPLKQMNRWFTRYLHGVENGVEQEPRARIVREGKKHDEATSYADYPNPEAREVAFYLHGGGLTAGKLLTQPPAHQTPQTIVDNYSFDGAALAQADWTQHRLLYVSPKLTAPVHLSGYAQIDVRLAINKPAANLSVWLVSLPWNASSRALTTDNVITRGWADPQNHASIDRGMPLTPGQFYNVSFDLQPDDQVVAVGQQIGLLVFSSDRDFTLHPQPGTELTVDLDQTRLTLPIVGGQPAWDHALERPPAPRRGVPLK